MKLMTKSILRSLPPLYGTENVPTEDKVIRVKYFDPCGSWTWYGVEYDPETKEFFGLVDGFEKEWGYFSLTELEEIKTKPFGLGIERDMYFRPKKVSELGGAK